MWCAERSTAALPTRNGSYCATGGCTTEEGDGPCEPGYYCPRGSSSSTQRPCCDARRDDFTGLWYTFNGRGFGTSNDVDVILLVDNEAEWGHSFHPPPGEVYDYEGFHQHAPARLARTCETLFCPRGFGRSEKRLGGLLFRRWESNDAPRPSEVRRPRESAPDAPHRIRSSALL